MTLSHSSVLQSEPKILRLVHVLRSEVSAAHDGYEDDQAHHPGHSADYQPGLHVPPPAAGVPVITSVRHIEHEERQHSKGEGQLKYNIDNIKDML